MVSPSTSETTPSRGSSTPPHAAKRGSMIDRVRRSHLLHGMAPDQNNMLEDEGNMEEYISRETNMEEAQELSLKNNSKPSKRKGLDERNILMQERRKSQARQFRLGQNDLDDLQKLRISESTRDVKEDCDDKPGGTSGPLHFEYVEIREYPITLGDNPGGSRGPPMTMEWTSMRTTKMKVEEFEASRESQRRHLGELRTTPKYRVELLKRQGVSVLDMYAAAKYAERVRINRHWTHANLNRMDFAERMETTRRAVYNILTLGRIKRREQQYLEKYVPSFSSAKSKESKASASQQVQYTVP